MATGCALPCICQPPRVKQRERQMGDEYACQIEKGSRGRIPSDRVAALHAHAGFARSRGRAGPAARIAPHPRSPVRVNRNSYLIAGLPEEGFWEQVEKMPSGYIARLPSLRARCKLYDMEPGNIEVEKLTNRGALSRDGCSKRLRCAAPGNVFE
jgi:hypothetical protein